MDQTRKGRLIKNIVYRSDGKTKTVRSGTIVDILSEYDDGFHVQSPDGTQFSADPDEIEVCEGSEDEPPGSH